LRGWKGCQVEFCRHGEYRDTRRSMRERPGRYFRVRSSDRCSKIGKACVFLLRSASRPQPSSYRLAHSQCQKAYRNYIRCLPFGILPLLFGLQKFFEGMVWTGGRLATPGGSSSFHWRICSSLGSHGLQLLYVFMSIAPLVTFVFFKFVYISAFCFGGGILSLFIVYMISRDEERLPAHHNVRAAPAF
jgi:hypothetical protein